MTTIFNASFENIIVGIVFAILGICAAKLKKLVYNAYINRKFPIGGDYLTVFVDEKEDGQKVITKAPATIKQLGRKFHGTTYLPGDNKSWEIEGEYLKNSGRIYGVYKAEDPADRGIGNFFLQVKEGRYMQGLWSGYDSKNDKINSGKYEFTPLAKDYKIVNINQVLIPSCVSIAEKELGKDYVTLETFSELITNKNGFGKVAINKKNGEVIGFYIGKIITSTEVKDILRKINIPKSLLVENMKIGLLRTVAIKESYKNKGIGSALTNDIIEEFKKHEVHTLVALAWKSHKGINIGGILKRFGFVQKQEIANYWSEDSKERNFICPDCQEVPCKCSAVLFIKHK